MLVIFPFAEGFMKRLTFLSPILFSILFCTVVQAETPENIAQRALQLMQDNQRRTDLSRNYLLQLDNPYQLDVLRLFLDHNTTEGEHYQIANKFPQFLAIANPHQVEAIRAFVENGRRIMPYFSYLTAVTNAYQAEAIRVFITGVDGENRPYEIGKQMPELLAIQDEVALQSLKALVAKHRSVSVSLPYLGKVRDADQLAMVREFADFQSFRKSIAFVLQKPIDLQWRFLKLLLAVRVDADVFEGVVERLEEICREAQVQALKWLITYHYDSRDLLDDVLNVGNRYQVDLINQIAERGLPLKKIFPKILEINNQAQVEAVQAKILGAGPLRTILAKWFHRAHPAFSDSSFVRVRELGCEALLY